MLGVISVLDDLGVGLFFIEATDETPLITIPATTPDIAAGDATPPASPAARVPIEVTAPTNCPCPLRFSCNSCCLSPIAIISSEIFERASLSSKYAANKRLFVLDSSLESAT